MNANQIFIADVEIEISQKSDLYEAGYSMAAVYCFVPAKHEEEARLRLKQEISKIDCEIVDLHAIRLYEGTIWEKKKDQKEFDGYAYEALKHNEVAFSQFMTYPKETY